MILMIITYQMLIFIKCKKMDRVKNISLKFLGFCSTERGFFISVNIHWSVVQTLGVEVLGTRWCAPWHVTQLWGKLLTLIFGCFNISSTIMPDLQIVWLMWPGSWIYQETMSRNVCYPLNAATQRGASPNSFKWFGSSPRVASSFTMSVYLRISCKNSVKSVLSHHLLQKKTRKKQFLPFTVILLPQNSLYWRVKDKLVLSGTFGVVL